MKAKFFLALVLCTSILAAQVVNDSITADTLNNSGYYKFNCKQLIMPSVLISYGVIGLESHTLIGLNRQLRDEVKEDIDVKITIDDFSQYAPIASVYALNAMGIQGKNNFKDRTIVMATSYLIMSGAVLGLKSLTKVERPDRSSKNSFPSGHTATAFAGAEFLWQEYKDKSIWYGIAGYAVATGTGMFRIYNDRHWLTDVAAGAGIGIMSTKIAYWLHLYTSRLFNGGISNGEQRYKMAIAPFYNGSQFGCSLVIQF
ncbi:phosphatase PAP2 family protein [Flavobacterium sp. DG1-102-2]|uniref:phosphatase PAP2 family protein n=1 Tax=Flavobacterium sp. DG1-102-2 TaxID=3081663 RepID=UPI002949B127|nr:phosphatase PAP2 family protein [Flavobacterium sp. DG1-102-2]MDV6167445.1 phosphatase PAP2 family protein [Flavobacterium sp. DG1-102-2]